MKHLNNLWLRDFTTVPATERRIARYILQLWFNDPTLLRKCLRSERYFDTDEDNIRALWKLIEPLLDPQAILTFLATLRTDLRQDANNLNRKEFEKVFEERLQEKRAIFLETLPRSILTRLVAADGDGNAAVSTAVKVLGEALGLSYPAIRLLDFLDLLIITEPLRKLLNHFDHVNVATNLRYLAAMTDLDLDTLRTTLDRRAPLLALKLVEYRNHQSDLEDFLQPSSILTEVLYVAPQNIDALRAFLIESAPTACWSVEEFPHLATQAERLQNILRRAVETSVTGVNILFYGPPGTGKTELARALAIASGLNAYQVRNTDDDGDGLRREGRLSAYLIAQRMLSRKTGSMLIFDEIEDVFDGIENQKGRINRILEENTLPAIWITNNIDNMDPAFLRRFLLPVAFNTPPRSVRRQMVDRHLGDCNLPSTLLEELADDTALAPAQFGAARRLLDLCLDVPPEQVVREGTAAIRTLLHGSPVPKQRRIHATKFDVAYLNLAGSITPSQIAQALITNGRGSLCFYGPPGTGKTAFSEVLALALDRELIAAQASDLISPYVGETEQRLAKLFRSIDPMHTILLLDEVDSFLSDRQHARYSWERTQVNELLQQMERFPGIFIAATNMMDSIDNAAMRRFDFKLHFRPLKPAQKVSLFAREVLGDATVTVQLELVQYLESLNGLTPGDFATVCRQRVLLGEQLTPKQFAQRLGAECDFKSKDGIPVNQRMGTEYPQSDNNLSTLLRLRT